MTHWPLADKNTPTLPTSTALMPGDALTMQPHRIFPARDALTGLARRDSFLRALELSVAAALASQSVLSLLVIQPDAKPQPGERVLSVVAQRIKLVGGRLAAMARLEGNSFAMLFPRTPMSAAMERAQMLCQTVRRDYEDLLGPLTLSVGAACGPLAGDWFGLELLQCAESRCRSARLDGGDAVRGDVAVASGGIVERLATN